MPTFQFMAHVANVHNYETPEQPVVNFTVTDLSEAVPKFFEAGYDLPYNADIFTNSYSLDMTQEFDVTGHRMNAAFPGSNYVGTFDTLVVNRQMVANGGKRRSKRSTKSRKAAKKSRRSTRRKSLRKSLRNRK